MTFELDPSALNGCEWSPTRSEPTYSDELHACTTPAMFSVGTGGRNIHLCAECAALPRFARWKKVPLTQELLTVYMSAQVTFPGFRAFADIPLTDRERVQLRDPRAAAAFCRERVFPELLAALEKGSLEK